MKTIPACDLPMPQTADQLWADEVLRNLPLSDVGVTGILTHIAELLHAYGVRTDNQQIIGDAKELEETAERFSWATDSLNMGDLLP